MKVLRSVIVVLIVACIIAASFYAFYMRPRYVVPILMYHGVNDDGSSSLNVHPDNFESQMRFLREEGYDVIPLAELVDGIVSGRKFDPGTVVITFDDGFEDNYRFAFPVLAKYGFPATIFLITGYIDKRETYLKWDQVRLMMDNGITFGGHTRNDIYLPSVSGDAEGLWEEVKGSREDIKAGTGIAPDFFCYPIGGYNEKIQQAVMSAGYKGACTTNRGPDRMNGDIFALQRVKVTNSDMTKPLHFRAKLSGYYNLFRSKKSPE